MAFPFHSHCMPGVETGETGSAALLTAAQRFPIVTLRSGLVAKALSRPTAQNVRRGLRPLWPFRSAPVLVLLQPTSQRFPVEPKPPLPRSVQSSSSTGSNRAVR